MKNKQNQKITPELREFFKELALLMEKYSVEMEATEECSGWSVYSDGIEFAINGKWDIDGNIIQESCLYRTNGRMIDHKDIKGIYENAN